MYICPVIGPLQVMHHFDSYVVTVAKMQQLGAGFRSVAFMFFEAI